MDDHVKLIVRDNVPIEVSVRLNLEAVQVLNSELLIDFLKSKFEKLPQKPRFLEDCQIFGIFRGSKIQNYRQKHIQGVI